MLSIPDILQTAATLGAALYCFILGRRLKSFNQLDKGVGGAVAVLSAQVDELQNALETAEKSAADSAKTLSDLNERADSLSNRLELHLASLQDIPDTGSPKLVQGPPKPSQPAEPMFTRHRSMEATQ
jgi:methyl-accepting chemotaxis protein